MIDIIDRLIRLGHAYAAEGHVLFHVPSWKSYGAFARKDRDEQIAGARVDVAAYKRDPADFVLWKPSIGTDPGWDSPWGFGRPGWHIECSAMSEKHLGPEFDIHGGGLDLIFPHHQNEIAQSCCANPGTGFAKYWMHNGYLLSEGEKMSKSLGNFYTVAELLAEYPGEALRLVLLKTHYRAPLDFTKARLAEAKAELDRFYRALAEVAAGDSPVDADAPIRAALEDDLNTAAAVTELHATLNAFNKGQEDAARAAAAATLKAQGALLGLLQQDPDSWFKGAADGDGAARIDALVAERAAAKAAKNFARADAIRADLLSEGVVLEDKPGGVTTWRRA
jgi:cysteinyl-tRNA synthetase